jgi:amino acid permease
MRRSTINILSAIFLIVVTVLAYLWQGWDGAIMALIVCGCMAVILTLYERKSGKRYSAAKEIQQRADEAIRRRATDQSDDT